MPIISTNASEGAVAATGRAVIHVTAATGDALILMFRALSCILSAWTRRAQIVVQMLVCGVYSLPVAMLVATFTGMVIALQTGAILQQYRQAAQVGALVAVSMCRELGPVWVGVILAARVGSAMAAELGTMRVSEEIDALEVMAIDPAKFLVMPRVLALVFMAPVLTVFADLVGTAGGAVVTRYQLGLEYGAYFRSASQMLTHKDILSGICVKAPVFGLIIATVGCSLGLNVRQSEGAEGVGAATRNSVVISLILIIVFDYILTSLIRHLI